MSAVQVSLNLGKVPAISNGRYELTGGTVVWFRDGKKHRENGPAEKNRSGYEAWFHRGLLHRDGGPAVTHPTGATEYWIKGQLIRKEDAPR
jgi:hypothetical protein